MNRRQEHENKITRLRQLMIEAKLPGLLLSTPANFSWATAGGNAVVSSIAPLAAASLLVTLDHVCVVCSNIEAGRIADEEVGELGCEMRSFDWFRGEVHAAARKICRGRLGADHPARGFKDVSGRIAPFRYSLCEAEVARYRKLCQATGESIGEVARSLQAGVRECEAAGRLRASLSARAIESVVTLAAADERIAKYRHPVVTDKEAKETLMLVTCARRWGLIAAATRIVRFSPVSRELRRKHDAAVFVDATMIMATRPGVALADILKRAVEAYRSRRFGKEWKLHHQGGPTGYAPREFTATPREKRCVVENQAIAWNPSITGTKSEDTILALEDRTEILTESPGWPMVNVEIEGQIVRRPDLLVL
jgi:Xaa-Pro aminopeptidase